MEKLKKGVDHWKSDEVGVNDVVLMLIRLVEAVNNMVMAGAWSFT